MTSKRHSGRRPARWPGCALGLVALAASALPAPPAGATPACRSELVVEGDTLRPLHHRAAHISRPTASTIKMLTALVAMDAIAAGELGWDTVYTVSHEAALVGGSQVYLEEGETFTLRELMEATLVESANDAAFAVAEAVAGSEPAFLERMRAKARFLDLEDWEIHSVNGLPSEKGSSWDDRMTAYDLARLGAEVMRHPELRAWVATDESTFRDGTFQLFSFNYLLRRYEPAEGIKTGYHRRAKFNLVGAARRDDLRLIAVVLGCQRKKQLFDRSEELFERAFDRYRVVPVAGRGQRLPGAVAVAGGDRKLVPVVAGDEVWVWAHRGRDPELQVLLRGAGARAPVALGERVGELVVRRGGRVVGRAPLLAAAAVQELPWWRRLWTRLVTAVPWGPSRPVA